MNSLLPPGARTQLYRTLLDGINEVRNAPIDAPTAPGAGPGPQAQSLPKSTAAGAGSGSSFGMSSGPQTQSVPQPAAASTGPGSSFGMSSGPQAQSVPQPAAAVSDNGFGRLNDTKYQTQRVSPDLEDGFGRFKSPDFEDGFGRLGSPDFEDGFGRLQPLDKPVPTISDQIQEMKKLSKAELNAILTRPRSGCGVFSETINHMPHPRARAPSLRECVKFIHDFGCGEARQKISDTEQQGSGQTFEQLFSHVCIDTIQQCMALKQAAEKSPDEVDPLHTHVGLVCERLPVEHDVWTKGVRCLYSTTNSDLWDLCTANLHSYV
jgi:hypothetical protein